MFHIHRTKDYPGDSMISPALIHKENNQRYLTALFYLVKRLLTMQFFLSKIMIALFLIIHANLFMEVCPFYSQSLSSLCNIPVMGF